MLNILLVSATRFEIEPTLLFLDTFKPAETSITTCVTGVGMVNTAFELGRLQGRKFDIAINAGIAGSFGKYKTGDVVKVTGDCFSELGAQNGEEFLSIDALGFGQQKIYPQHLLENAFTKQIPEASAITVNTTHGNTIAIEKIIERYKADIETMEGAAFIHAANAFGWRAIQLRAISNKVERRNKDAWDIPLAIKKLNVVLTDLIKNLNEY